MKPINLLRHFTHTHNERKHIMNNTNQPSDNTLHVECKSNYGNTLVYPACAKSQTFARIAGTKTLNDTTRDLIKSLGFRFQEVRPRQVNL
jgi:hypothetical protein